MFCYKVNVYFVFIVATGHSRLGEEEEKKKKEGQPLDICCKVECFNSTFLLFVAIRLLQHQFLLL